MSAVKSVIDRDIIPQNWTYKINSLMENVAIFLASILHVIDKYEKYQKNFSDSAIYLLQKKQCDLLRKKIFVHLERILNYAQIEADKKNATACLLVGTQILQFKFRSEQFDKALNYLKFSAENNNLIAQSLVSYLYLLLDDVSNAKYFAHLAENNYIEGVDLVEFIGIVQFVLGRIAIEEKNYSKGYKLYEQAITNDSANAANDLGFAYQNGIGVPVDYKKAVEYYQFAAERDESTAQYNLGYMFYNGLGVAKDETQALKWIRKAAENDSSAAQETMASFALNGDCGLNKNPHEAIKWLNILADNGNEEAMVGIINLYWNGAEGLNPNYKKAVTLAEQFLKKYEVPKKHNEVTETRKGYFNKADILTEDSAFEDEVLEELKKDDDSNFPLKKNYSKPLKTFEGDQNATSIAMALAFMYMDGGYGISKNMELATHWFEVSANAGNEIAQYQLGYNYATGEGVPIDYEKAHYWLEKSAAQGQEQAIRGLADLNEIMNRAEQDNSSSSSDVPNDNSSESSGPFGCLLLVVFVVGGFMVGGPLGALVGFWIWSKLTD